jgi:hypothetical protein
MSILLMHNYRIQKMGARCSTGTTVAGGNGMGSNANQPNFANNFIDNRNI